MAKKASRKSLIDNIGDVYALADYSPRKLGKALGVTWWTVENWRFNGIPTKYWDKLYEIYGLSPAELHSISKKCRANKDPT